MNTRNIILAAALVAASISVAKADEPRPLQGQKIDLGNISGVAYYTAAKDGFHVVATLGQDGVATPVRFEAVLNPGQSVVLSAPRAAGTEPDAIEISRVNDRMTIVRKTATN